MAGWLLAGWLAAGWLAGWLLVGWLGGPQDPGVQATRPVGGNTLVIQATRPVGGNTLVPRPHSSIPDG